MFVAIKRLVEDLELQTSVHLVIKIKVCGELLSCDAKKCVNKS
jgi:hypothetical protein